MSTQDRKLSDKWFEQWTQTDTYLASDGHSNRIPLRLASTNVVLYGKAKLTEVLKEFEHEDHRPVTVGGDVPVQKNDRVTLTAIDVGHLLPVNLDIFFYIPHFRIDHFNSLGGDSGVKISRRENITPWNAWQATP